jgi:hypothetical protein
LPKRVLDGDAESRRNESDLNRAKSQADRILAALRANGQRGCLNTELYAITPTLPQRFNDLRRRGHRIEATHEEGAVWRYHLVYPKPANPLPTKTLSGQPGTLPLFDEVPH